MWGKQKSNTDAGNTEDTKKTQQEEVNHTDADKDTVSAEKNNESDEQKPPEEEKAEKADVKQLLDRIKQLEGKAAESERLRLLALADMDN